MSAAALMRTAASQIGETEHPPRSNHTKYWAAMYPAFQGAAWCLCWVQWCLKQNGSVLPCPARFSCGSAEAWARAHGKWLPKTATVRAGDIVIYGNSRAQHVGFVEKSLPGGRIQTIEGNTSPTAAGSQNNGGGVYRKVRSRSWVRGFIRLDMGGTHVPPVAANHPFTTTTRRGDHGAVVMAVQARLIHYGAKITADGSFGPATEGAVKAFQRTHHLTVDGVVGRNTWAALYR